MTIGGRLIAGDATIEVVNPATGRVFAAAPDCSRAQLDDAVAAAAEAFLTWRTSTIADRRAAVIAIAVAMEAHVEELAALLTAEQGKPIADARGEIGIAAHRCRGTAALDLVPEVKHLPPDRAVRIEHVPLGVVGAIAPWNFPISLALQKVASALMAGNTVVLKPSPFTPLTTLRIGELVRGHLPAGVLNIVAGGHDLGPWITAHPGIAKISFTGSVATGRAVMAGAAQTLKRVTLELGGNDAAIVFPDVDVAATAERLAWAAFLNAGQICIAAKRIYVHADIYDRFRDAFTACVAGLRIGPGDQPGVQIGPVQNAAQVDRLRGLIAECCDAGYRLITAPAADAPPEGYFLPLTIVDNPPDASRIVQEEQFGPIVPLLRFEDVDDLVRRVNATPYGLGASIWSADTGEAARLATRIDSGTVWINEVQRLSPAVPFGGHKHSGIGAEGGLDGLRAYTDVKVTTCLPD